MNRRGNYDEKPSYEDLASVLRWIVYVGKNYPLETKEEQLKRVLFQAKAVVKELDRVEAKQYKEVVLSIPNVPVTKWECYDENGLRCKGEFIP